MLEILVVPTHHTQMPRIEVSNTQSSDLVPDPQYTEVPNTQPHALVLDPLFSDLDFPIALCKETRDTRRLTMYPVTHYVTFNHLSFAIFSTTLSSVTIPKTYEEVMAHPGWRAIMEEKRSDQF